MDSHHTGSEELFFIQTPQISVTMKGRSLYPRATVLGTEEPIASFALSCKDEPEKVRFLGEEMDPGLGNMAVKPVFYEQSPYELVVENRGESEIKFRHVNSRI